MNVAVLGALFSIGAAPRPSNLGVQVSLLCWAGSRFPTLLLKAAGRLLLAAGRYP